jgi:uncharacterized protein YecA (UPF0149 family)
MPTRTYRRIWCKTCNEFELHETKKLFDKEWFCRECDTEYTSILLSDIPREKRVEQRERYTDSKNKAWTKMYGSLLNGSSSSYMDLLGMFGSHDFQENIQESDAGQRKLDEIHQMKVELAREKRRVQRQKDLELKKNFHKLGRNDKCLCGSEKKYKKCCYSKIQKI